MLDLTHLGSGKVREIYLLDPEHLLFVATDRISAYDVILSPDVPDKGRVLTGMSEFFFKTLEVPNHYVTSDISLIPNLSETDRRSLAGRTMIVRKAEMVPLEGITRGYLYGSAWREYSSGGGPATENLPPGLTKGSKLDSPIFTPSTKAEAGHDLNLTESEARHLVGDEVYERVRDASISVFQQASSIAEARGMILVDTKFEFGMINDELVLADEVLTPDSSRYWGAEDYQIGVDVPSFDKQYVRDFLDESGWDHVPPAPTLPESVVTGTRSRYIEAFERITGESFDQYLKDVGA